MTSKWDINKAVRSSGLAAPSRLIMLTLSDLADAKTAEIPAEHTPSLREISEMTGLSKAGVTKHLTELESNGWIIRDRPDIEAARRDHARTGYRLAVGGMSTQKTSLVSEEDKPMSTPETSHVHTEDKGMSTRETVPYTYDHYQTNTTVAAADAPPPKRKRKPRKPASKTKPGRQPPPQRLDVERICKHLADRIEANGSKRPVIGKTWLNEGRLLLDADGRTVEQVLKAIDWCQADPFWRGVILSMPALRKKYDQLRLAAQRPNGRASPSSQLTEVNGMLLKPSNVEAHARQQRMQALQAKHEAAQQLALGGSP